MSNLTSKTGVELVTMFMTADKDGKAAITAEMTRRDTATAVTSSGAPAVDFNSSGGIFIQEGGKNTLAASGNMYAASANLPVGMAELICGDSPVSVDLRKRVMALLAMPEDKRAAIVEAKSAKKADRESKEIAKQRATLSAAVKAGSLPKSVLDEFNAKNPIVSA